MNTKICKKCGKEFPFEMFYKSSSCKDGFMNKCKECHNKQVKEWRYNNKERVKEIQKNYRDNNGEKTKIYYKAYSEKNRDKIREKVRKWSNSNKERVKEIKYKSNTKNKEKVLEKAKKYREKNKETVKERTKIWKSNNKDKVCINNQKRRTKKKELPHTLTFEQWEQTKKCFDNCCAYCGEKLSLEQEHFIPLSKGGEYTINNIIPACEKCNCSKNNKDFFKWYPKYKYYSKKREEFILKFLGYKEGLICK